MLAANFPPCKLRCAPSTIQNKIITVQSFVFVMVTKLHPAALVFYHARSIFNPSFLGGLSPGWWLYPPLQMNVKCLLLSGCADFVLRSRRPRRRPGSCWPCSS